MSMIGNFLAISQAQLNALIANPDEINSLIDLENDSGAPADILDIDKAWHGIHYLLTGREGEGSDVWSWVILGGVPIGPDIGYGPARYLTPQQVREIAQALTNLSRAELAKRYAPQIMEKIGIYPNIWVDDDDEGLEYLLENYENLVKYYHAAAAKSDAMLLYLT